MRAIDADKFKEWIRTPENAFNKNADRYFSGAVDKQPTLDVQPVVHAHWEDISVHSFESAIVPQGQKKMKAVECSHCQTVLEYPWIGKFQYCPWCGAKIDEVTE